MSILIKGLDMPKLNENEEHLWVPGWIEVGKDDKAIFCTGTHFDPNTIHSYAVEEVPTPHGRLVDSNELLDDFMKAYPVGSPDLGCAFEIIENAETFIKAEGVNE